MLHPFKNYVEYKYTLSQLQKKRQHAANDIEYRYWSDLIDDYFFSNNKFKF